MIDVYQIVTDRIVKSIEAAHGARVTPGDNAIFLTHWDRPTVTVTWVGPDDAVQVQTPDGQTWTTKTYYLEPL